MKISKIRSARKPQYHFLTDYNHLKWFSLSALYIEKGPSNTSFEDSFKKMSGVEHRLRSPILIVHSLWAFGLNFVITIADTPKPEYQQYNFLHDLKISYHQLWMKASNEMRVERTRSLTSAGPHF